MAQLRAENSRQVPVLGISGSDAIAETDGWCCQRACCQHLSPARWFDPALDLAELSFAVVHNVSELSKAEASGKTLSPEFLAKQTRFVIHLVTLHRCRLGAPEVNAFKDLSCRRRGQAESGSFPFPFPWGGSCPMGETVICSVSLLI
jgi:hypothetical protein